MISRDFDDCIVFKCESVTFLKRALQLRPSGSNQRLSFHPPTSPLGSHMHQDRLRFLLVSDTHCKLERISKAHHPQSPLNLLFPALSRSPLFPAHTSLTLHAACRVGGGGGAGVRLYHSFWRHHELECRRGDVAVVHISRWVGGLVDGDSPLARAGVCCCGGGGHHKQCHFLS